PLNAKEVIGAPRASLRVQNSREGIDDVVRGHLAAVVEFHTLPEGEGPGQPVARGHPELGEGRRDAERLVELDQTVEDLLPDRETVDAPQPSGVKRRRIVPEWASIAAARLRGWALLGLGRTRREAQGEPERPEEQAPPRQ